MEPDGQQQGPGAPPGVAYTHCWCRTVPVGVIVCIQELLSFCSASGVAKLLCFVFVWMRLCFCVLLEICFFSSVI